MRGPVIACCIGVLALASACTSDTHTGGSTLTDGGGPLGQAGASGATGSAGQPGKAGAQASAGRTGQAGTTGNAGSTGSAGGAGTAGNDGSAGKAGSAAPGGCPPNLALPAICRMCGDGSCGTPECKDGRFSAWRCPEDDGQPSGLRWYTSCGAPVCGSQPDPFDDPNVPNCTTEEEGDACSEEGKRCDGVADCGATLICAKSDPTMGPVGCPRSRARFKDDIAYLNEQQLRDYHAQLVSLPLASYQYKNAPAAGPQLGFIIEDIEPSAAVSGDRVNLYGYLSMAVAAIQVQQEQIAALKRELETLREQVPAGADAVCAGW